MVWSTRQDPRQAPPYGTVGKTLLVACAALALVHGPAQAALGGAKAMSTADRAALGAQALSTTSMPAYDRTETTTADGTSVREFSAKDGTVFAVDFAGPTMPDLKAVLGTSYDAYAAAARSRAGSHHVMSVATGDAVITIVKLPRGFSGHAHLPAAIPAGVDVNSLR